ncbi:DoxX family protein [Prevotella falsenii]|uniref:DoxX family protein n=1 Tax=Prevotella falsenii TaxID=515414 RepID=UPI0004687405|nr:DoxX family protein [Prevotella falsenii]
MTLNKDFLRSNDFGLLVLRLTVGGLMLFHGVAKVMGGYAFIGGMLESMGLPSFIAWFAVATELIGSIMIVLGIWTRAAAVVMVGNMVVAILMAHMGQIFTIDPATGGWAIELPMLYLLGAAALCFTGAGRFALTKGSVLD